MLVAEGMQIHAFGSPLRGCTIAILLIHTIGNLVDEVVAILTFRWKFVHPVAPASCVDNVVHRPFLSLRVRHSAVSGLICGVLLTV